MRQSHRIDPDAVHRIHSALQSEPKTRPKGHSNCQAIDRYHALADRQLKLRTMAAGLTAHGLPISARVP
jgi:hypothetical protein